MLARMKSCPLLTPALRFARDFSKKSLTSKSQEKKSIAFLSFNSGTVWVFL
jgi:hypothetical protein